MECFKCWLYCSLVVTAELKEEDHHSPRKGHMLFDYLTELVNLSLRGYVSYCSRSGQKLIQTVDFLFSYGCLDHTVQEVPKYYL